MNNYVYRNMSSTSSANDRIIHAITATEKLPLIIDDIDNEFDEEFFSEGDQKENMQKKKKLLRGDSSPNHKESARGEKKIKSREIEMNTLESIMVEFMLEEGRMQELSRDEIQRELCPERSERARDE